MMSPKIETVVEALKIVRTGGDLGLLLGEFSAKWPTRLGKGKVRKSNGPVAQFLSGLVDQGLVDRSAHGLRGRFTLTPAGERFLVENKPARPS